MDALSDLVFRPGSAKRLVPIINVTIMLLMATVMIAYALGFGSVHLIVLAILATGLLTSLNWFMAEYQRVLDEKGSPESEGAVQHKVD